MGFSLFSFNFIFNYNLSLVDGGKDGLLSLYFCGSGGMRHSTSSVTVELGL